MSVSAAPVNDNLADATLVSGSEFHVSGNNSTATAETDEPAHGGWNPVHTLWWQWQAPADGGVTADSSGSSMDTVLAAYSGDSLPDLVLRASNDDADLTSNHRDLTSRIQFNAVKGVVYKFAVGSVDPARVGVVKLNLKTGIVFMPPANDNFSQASVISGSILQVSSSNLVASIEPSEPMANDTDGTSVWWTWTPSLDGYHILTLEESNFDTVLSVYQGATLENLNVIARNDDLRDVHQSRVLVPLRAGTPCKIQVSGYGGAWGDIKLDIQHFAPSDALDYNFRDTFRFNWTRAGLLGKVTLLHFWDMEDLASLDFIDALNHARTEFTTDDLIILAPCVTTGSQTTLDQFGLDNEVRYILGEAKAPLPAQFNVTSVPTTVLVDQDGKVIETIEGGFLGSELEIEIRQMLAVKKTTGLPTLKAEWTGQTLTVSWPSADEGAILEASPDLSPGSWIPANILVTDDGSSKTVHPPLDANHRYYRLRK